MSKLFPKKILFTIYIMGLFGVFLALYLAFRAPAVAPTPVVVEVEKPEIVHTVIGKSVEGRNIDAYTYGNGEKHLVIVGGIHGGYEWNSIVLAYRLKDYFDVNLDYIPKNVTLTIIPSANPDGLYKVTGKESRPSSADIPEGVDTSIGRFNANKVDLNRNFDCKWQATSTWRSAKVSAGTEPFSEPEAWAIKDFAEKKKPIAFVFLHSQSGAVYASQCEDGILPETLRIMNIYAKASAYKAVPVFEAYQTTGDSEAWLASIGIPAITVELTTHESLEWDKNLAGVKALLDYYRE